MNKKIISIFLLLIILASILVAYIYIKQTSTEEKKLNSAIETVDDKTISSEINNTFINETGEIVIGDMI